ncbi:hypothetical protein [Piscinibacter sp.]|uniref:hypothetical protein n=1 Tax=Piscinibacter sp. TaxID=1903157 RepID=UPI002B6211EF|nr:hypothetical protein [Albitalea sp.]HUG21359.1 hypothetical protein [Albitalea sp.]
MPMQPDAIPVKTPQGHDELRQRTLKLGQRHRTVLFLIDGRRPLGEVLSLAEQAGAAASHFDELVQLGLVELPVEALPEPVSASVPLEEPTAEDAEAPAAAEEPVQAHEPELQQLVVPPEEPAAVPPQLHQHEQLQPSSPPLPSAAPALRGIDVAQPHPEPSEDDLLQQVRELLTDSLRLDAPLFSARTFVRVRSAQSAAELIALAWEIENHLTRARHPRRELLSLERARELLGLGNTRAADESRPGRVDE